MVLIVRPIEIDDLPALYRLIPRLWIEQEFIPTNEKWIETSGDFIKKHLGDLVMGGVAIDPDNPKEIVSCGFGVIW